MTYAAVDSTDSLVFGKSHCAKAANRDAIRIWRGQHAQYLFDVAFEPLPGTRFHAAFEPVFKPLRIARTRLSPGRIVRDEALVRECDEWVALLMSRSNTIEIAHRRRELRLGCGDATILHAGETASFGSRGDFGYLAVVMPCAQLAACASGLDAAVARRVARRNPALQLLSAYLRALEKRPAGASTVIHEPIRRHVIDLVALAITPHDTVGESDLGAVAAARLAAALDCIARRFHEPELTIADVAASQGISPRYLQRLIETRGTSFTEHVNELRLQEAFRRLRDAGNGQRIADIALEAGFSDISTFNRLFRSRFGDTPSGIRAQAASLAVPFHGAAHRKTDMAESSNVAGACDRAIYCGIAGGHSRAL
jgi:AraC-like DNA-binding protein